MVSVQLIVLVLYTYVITHGLNMQGCCRKCSLWSCWSRTQPQNDLGTLVSCRNTSVRLAGSSSIWPARSRVHMSGQQRWPALWQHDSAPDEIEFLEPSQSCGKITTNTVQWSDLSKGENVSIWITMTEQLTISSLPLLCSRLWGKAHSLCLLRYQNASYKRTAIESKKHKKRSETILVVNSCATVFTL